MKQVVKAHIEKEIKIKAEQVFDSLGITTAQAIRLFFYQVAKNKKFPFDLNSSGSGTYFLSKIA